ETEERAGLEAMVLFAIYDALFGELQPRREVCDGNSEPKDKEQTEPRENSSDEPRSLLVRNLHSDVTEQELHAVFLPFGPICTVQVCRDRRTNHSRGYAFVTFECRHDAENALSTEFFRAYGQTDVYHVGPRHDH
uniref:RRM domain-containing protein n=1 Tax=Sinocyclocheilus anshuiensis TaxID=1608454 RepID=A0A671LNR4_9TELE